MLVASFENGFCKETVKSEKRGVDTAVSYTSAHSGFTGGHSGYATPAYSNGYNSQHATPSGYTSLHGTPASYSAFHTTPTYTGSHATPSYSGAQVAAGYNTLHGTPSPPFHRGHSSYQNQQPLIHAVNPFSVAISQRYQPVKLSLVKIPQPIFVPRIVLQPFDHSFDHISPFNYPH